MRIEYVKGKSNKGTIMENIYAGETTYIAVTAATSKTFKTIKGADKYMTKFGYEKVN